MTSVLKAAAKQIFDLFHANELILTRRRRELLVLCYHGVVAERRPDRWSYENWIAAEDFRAQIRWLRRWCEPVDLEGLARWQDGRWSGKRGPVLITFDDGYRNNLTIAAPILKEEGVPALFFLTTGYIGTSRTLWNDEVRVRVLHWEGEAIRMPSGEVKSIPAGVAGRRRLADEAAQTSKRLPEEPRREYVDYLRSHTLSVETMDDPEARAFMNWDEARSLIAEGFEIGSHTVEHSILSMIGSAEVIGELRDSKSTLERELKTVCKTIAYPNGTDLDVNDTLFQEVARAGYEWGFTTIPGWEPRGGDPRRLGRLCAPGHTDLATFKIYASGLHERLARSA